MSNMLEQAIADAAALREQAIKSAEQSVIDKYSQQIKEAVDKMLESDNPLDRANKMLEEAEEELNEEMDTMPSSFGGGQEGATIEAPPAWDSRYNDIAVKFNAIVDGLPEISDGVVELDLGDFELSPEEEEALGSSETDQEPTLAEPEGEDTGGGDEDLDALLGALQEGKKKEDEESEEESSEDDEMNEILRMLEEEIEVDFGKEPWTSYGSGQVGGSASHETARKYGAESRKAYEEQMLEDESEEETSSDEVDETVELYETIEALKTQNDKLASVLEKLEVHLEEALLSNAKLLYQNRTLGDASLNERQKSKIVEAIANAESTKEAKQLFETLKATVGSTPSQKKGPQSLSESVNRKSNLSAMLNSRQNINESKQSADPFMEKMQKLAGIKK